MGDLTGRVQTENAHDVVGKLAATVSAVAFSDGAAEEKPDNGNFEQLLQPTLYAHTTTCSYHL